MVGEKGFEMGNIEGSRTILSQPIVMSALTPIASIWPIRHTRAPVFFLYLTGAAPPGAILGRPPAPFLPRQNRLSSAP